MATTHPIEAFGFSSVPRSFSKLLEQVDKKNNKPLLVEDLPLPHSNEFAKNAHAYAKEHLPPQTFSHSMRAFLWGSALLQTHLPDLTASASSSSFLETFYLSCLLHDIGTTPENLKATLMSFETYGGFLTLEMLQKWGASKPQAESVCEAIVRHQDLGESGEITGVGGLLQVVTLLDNIGGNVELIHQDTFDDVLKTYPRNGWTSCFASTIRKEISLKPWSHSTAIDNFAENVESNKVWPKYD